jgi:hypothetical protein
MLSIDNELTEQVGGQVPASDLNVAARTEHRHAIPEVAN